MANYTCRYNTIHHEEEEKITTYNNDILLASDFTSAAVCTLVSTKIHRPEIF